jgi:hypothetical protein
MSTSQVESPGNPAETPAAPAPTAAPSPVSSNREQAAAAPEEEIDVWWGSYSMWTMTPSLLVCILLTGAIVWAAWYFLPLRDLPLVLFTLMGTLWLVQTIRWAYRIVFYNYRLTTRRLLLDRGLLYPSGVQAELARIASVQVQTNGIEKRLGVGRIVISFEKNTPEPVVLEGVHGPTRIADLIRQTACRARENNIVAGRG